MTKTYIDYTKLINSSLVINDLETSTTNKVKTSLEEIYTQLINFGNLHDNCFSKVTEDNVLEGIDTVSQSLINVSAFLDNAVDKFSTAETLCMKEFNITSVD